MSASAASSHSAPTLVSTVFRHPVLGVASRLLVGGLFIYAAAGKVFHPAEFARIIYGYRLLHADLVNLPAMWLPWIELLAGVLLVVGLGRRSAGLVTSGLLVVFLVGGGLGVLRGLDVECGCFTVSGGTRLGWSVLLRDASLLAASVYAMLHPSDAWSLDRLAESKSP